MEGRLPSDVRPTAVRLELTVDPHEPDYRGRVEIPLQLDAPRSVIWLHGRDMEDVHAELRVGEETLDAEFVGHADEGGFAQVRLPRAVVGEALLTIDFRHAFGDALAGLYRVEHDGRDYAFTQMEPLDARASFPCFDEPGFKVPWTITLNVPEGMAAAANTPLVDESPRAEGESAGVAMRFAPTRPMPSYLVAFAVGPFDVVEGEIPPNAVRREPLPFRTLTAAGRGADAAYTMENTPGILESLETWFGIPYPYRKLDLVAVPDFGAGAMENVGLVTFRDTLLLVAPETTTAGRMRFWAYIVAHELAHMWFGDLVTMAWWDDLWLNEAFASWMEHRAVEGWHPAYEPNVALFGWVRDTMESDSLVSARSIQQPIEAVDDIHNAFDGIPYGKGAGVLAMFESWIGRPAFQRGIRNYLVAHRDGNATGDDLLRALSLAAERDVATPFSTFLTQPGVPLVDVALSCEGTPHLTLTQSRYLPVGSSGDADRRWQIPVCLRHGAGRLPPQDLCVLLTEQTQDVPLDACPEYVHPNAQGAGYYRWTLPAEQLARLGAVLRLLPTNERLSYADALMASFDAGAPGGDLILDGLVGLLDDPHHAVAAAPLELLEWVGDHALAEGDQARYQRRLQRALARQVRELGWSPRRREDERTRLRRSAVLRFAAEVAETPRVRREAAALGRRYANLEGEGFAADVVQPDLATLVLRVAVAEDEDGAIFDALLGRLPGTSDGMDRGRILNALAATDDPSRAAQLRALLLGGTLRVNERVRPLWAQLSRPETHDAAWAWLEANFARYVEALPAPVAGELPGLSAEECSAEAAARVEALYGPRVAELPGGPRNLAAALESIRVCAAEVEAQRAAVAEWVSR